MLENIKDIGSSAKEIVLAFVFMTAALAFILVPVIMSGYAFMEGYHLYAFVGLLCFLAIGLLVIQYVRRRIGRGIFYGMLVLCNAILLVYTASLDEYTYSNDFSNDLSNLFRFFVLAEILIAIGIEMFKASEKKEAARKPIPVPLIRWPEFVMHTSSESLALLKKLLQIKQIGKIAQPFEGRNWKNLSAGERRELEQLARTLCTLKSAIKYMELSGISKERSDMFEVLVATVRDTGKSLLPDDNDILQCLYNANLLNGGTLSPEEVKNLFPKTPGDCQSEEEKDIVKFGMALGWLCKEESETYYWNWQQLAGRCTYILASGDTSFSNYEEENSFAMQELDGFTFTGKKENPFGDFLWCCLVYGRLMSELLDKDMNMQKAMLLLSSLLKSYRLPVIFLEAADRETHLDALKMAKSGDYAPLVQLFFQKEMAKLGAADHAV